MRRQKKCRSCHRWYTPHPQTYRHQKTCRREQCRRQRRRQAWKAWSLKNPLYSESRKDKLRAWRQRYGTVYMRHYRKKHPAYVRRNRKLQHHRNAKARDLIVKPNAWNSLHLEKIKRIQSLGLIVKPNEWTNILHRQIDGLCRYLEWSSLIVKPNAISPR